MDRLRLIALPELQRPYVWSKDTAKELLDSMYRGFPIGHFLFWKNSDISEARFIGTGKRQQSPELLVIDGQQRLTSLYAIMSGKPVLDSDFTPQHIDIAFNPLEECFALPGPGVRNNRNFIPNISPLWSSSSSLFDIRDQYVEALQSVRDITAEDQKKIKASLIRLADIKDYSITALELLPSLGDEEVSEIFLRINSQGQPLTSADFIRTLIAVSWSEGRAQVDEFIKRARHNFSRGIVEPNADQLLRASVALAFRKPQLKDVYTILRGRDIKTGQSNPQQRRAQFETLKPAQQKVLDGLHWQAFQHCTALAGYRNRNQVTSERTVIFFYVLYLIGRTEYDIPEYQLRRAIAKCFFACMLTSRYERSELRMETDLTQFGKTKKTPEYFLTSIDKLCEAATRDIWHTLPDMLSDPLTADPVQKAYLASLVVLEAKALFSKFSVAEFIDPAHRTKRTLDRYALFPNGYLKSKNVKAGKERSHPANYTIMEWDETFDERSCGPQEYVAAAIKRFEPNEILSMYKWHGLPENWEAMPYREFIRVRRSLMGDVIRRAYEELSRESSRDRHSSTATEIIKAGEGPKVEFKASLRRCTTTGKDMPELRMAVTKTIAAFLNSHGGHLLIGVSNDQTPIGTGVDGFDSEDAMMLYLSHLVRNDISPHAPIYIDPRFEDHAGQRILVVQCSRARLPVYVKSKKSDRTFYIRNGAETVPLAELDAVDYQKCHFPERM